MIQRIWFKFLLGILLSAIFTLSTYKSVSAATYYVANAGNDACDGTSQTLASSGSCAWKTIAKVNSSVFSAGDSILLNKGDTWREQLTVPNSGSSGNPITIGAYGSGAKPTILGSASVSGWDQNNIGYTADILTESFENTKPTNAGYDNAGWSESVGAGSILDTDYTGVTPPPGGGNQLLRIKKITPNFNARTRLDLGSVKPTTYTTFWIMPLAGLTTNSQEIYSVSGTDSTLSPNTSWDIKIRRTSEPYNVFKFAYNGGVLGGQWPGSGVGSFDSTHWYEFRIKYVYNSGTTTADYQAQILDWGTDGATGGTPVTIASGTTAAGAKPGVQGIYLGDSGDNLPAEYVLDLVRVGTTNYPEGITVLPANVWKANLVASPVSSVWAVNNDASVSWGNKKTSIGTLGSEYDWFWDTRGILLLYAATSPDTRYTSVESSVRNYGVYSNPGINYLTIDGVQTAYVNTAGITIRSNSIVQNSLSHHIGDRISGNPYNSLAAGISIPNSSGSVAQNNTVHDAGERGISVAPSGGGTESNNIVQNNTVYDCYHAAIDFDMGAPSTATGNIARYNFVYFTSGMSMSPGSSAYGGISIGGDSVNTAILDGTQVYYNVVLNPPLTGIDTHDYTSNTNIYNNVIYGYHPSTTSTVYGIKVGGPNTSGTNNVKNNICVGAKNYCFFVFDHTKITSVDNNLWYQSVGAAYTNIDGTNYFAGDQTVYKLTGFDTHGLWQDPLFVTAGTDFHLQRSSAAINAGANVSLTSDYAGTSVPQGSAPEMGAYEYTPLTVTINQAGGQADPTNSSPVNFTVVFSGTVSDFATGDVTLSGTAGATTGTVTGSGTTYNVAVSGMTGPGTVVASLAVGVATGSTGNTNDVSTSTDNSVTYDSTAPTGGSITYTDGNYSIASVSLTAADGTDTVSGVNTLTRTVQRKSATLTAGTCGSYGGFGTITVAGSYPNYTDSTVASGNCYQYQYLVSDNAGNQATYTSTNTAKVSVPPSSTPTPAPANSSSVAAPVCGDTTPTGLAPWLFEANSGNGNSVTLRFTNWQSPVDHFAVEYGTSSGNYQYAANNIGGNGTNTYVVSYLLPYTTYFFRVRSGNGCATGSWSNEISAKTLGLVSTNQLAITQSELTTEPTTIENQPINTGSSCQSYTVKPGDNLWNISQSLLGDGNKFEDLISQNKDQYPSLATSSVIIAGWELRATCGNQPSITTNTSNPSNTPNVPSTSKAGGTQKIDEPVAQTGYDVKIKVTDTNKNPVEGATVTIHSIPQTTKTDLNGIASFTNVEAGEHKVLIAYNSFAGEQTVNLTGDVKEFNLNITVQQKAISLSPLAIWIIGVMAVMILTLVVLLAKAKRKI